jgi:hypothetical protein
MVSVHRVPAARFTSAGGSTTIRFPYKRAGWRKQRERKQAVVDGNGVAAQTPNELQAAELTRRAAFPAA